ncbi:MAG: hypothetical protein AMJ41_01290 [candidate division Zixibacteria bacterium DG_27]|nr:MAG: hypothetical protein AMJ41_01290 [candidate division Zixibacteria bacterium DG_27]
MLRTIFTIAASMMTVTILLLSSCDRRVTEVYYLDDTPPAIPSGVYSVTGDREVTVYWSPVIEADCDGYNVYRGDSALVGPYYLLVTLYGMYQDYYTDTGLLNGKMYYYAVASFDESGNESELSYEDVFDTPRPEGYDVTLYDFDSKPDSCGFNLSTQRVVRFDSYNNTEADFYLDYDNGNLFMSVAKDFTYLQDMGYTESLDEIGYAPAGGWSQWGRAEAIPYHTYVVLTEDDHYAKIRLTVVSVSLHRIVLDWAYQTDPGNRELSLPPTGEASLY